MVAFCEVDQYWDEYEYDFLAFLVVLPEDANIMTATGI